MSARPRTPRYFPKIKVRGARRRRRHQIELYRGSLDRLEVAFLRVVADINVWSRSAASSFELVQVSVKVEK